MLSPPMLTAALIAMAALVSVPVATPAQQPAAPMTLVALPAEPGAQALSDAPTLQAVAGDLDADGIREVTAISLGEDGSVILEGWAQAGDRWEPLGSGVPVGPDPGEPAAARLLVRATSDGEHVTLLWQPTVPGSSAGAPCCLHVEDVFIGGNGGIGVRPVAQPLDALDAIFAVDLDGDGTDELFGSRSLPPLGDISYPTATAVLRWNGQDFDAPALAELPVGSGDTPFVLGDTDGVPGEELAIAATLGRSELHRIALGPDSELRVDDAGIAPLPADLAAVHLGDGVGVALLSTDGVLEVRPWPAGQAIGDVIARTRTRFASQLLGSVDVGGTPMIALRQSSGADALHLRQLPGLSVPPGSVAPLGSAAPTFGAAPVLPYVGPLPGGGSDGAPAIMVAGRLVMGGTAGSTPVQPMALLAGAAPIGLVGVDRSWLAIQHLAASASVEPSGGRLDLPPSVPGSGITVAPLGVTSDGRELGDARFSPATSGGMPGPAGSLTVGPAGFRALIDAPAGSRIHVAGLDPSVAASVLVVGSGGHLEVPMLPPVTGIPNPRYRAALAVTTPAGHSYLATWDVRVATEAPNLEASVSTPLGSGAVLVRGTTAPDSSVVVAGVPVPVRGDGTFEASVVVPPWPTDVVVRAAGPFGAESRAVLSAIGLFDYRDLPWIGIVAAALALVAVMLAIRIPQRSPAGQRADDDGTLEELDGG